jgi:hypothetical protein
MEIKQFREWAALFRKSADIVEEMANTFEDESLSEEELELKIELLMGKYAYVCAKINNLGF